MSGFGFKGALKRIRPFTGLIIAALLIVTALMFLVLERTESQIISSIRTYAIEVIAPVADSLSKPLNRAKEYITDVQSLVSIKEEITRLRKENQAMKELQVRLVRLEERNKKLATMLNFHYPSAVKYTAGEVIMDSAGAFANSLIVRVGKNGGVEKGDAALFEGVLVGRVIYVGDEASQVLLLTDVSSRVPVFVGKGRIKAILAGNNTNKPILTQIENIEEIKPDDEVITSGIFDTLPQGLKIGKVSKDALINGYDDITVNLFMRRNHLDTLRIINFGRAAALQDIGRNKQ